MDTDRPATLEDRADFVSSAEAQVRAMERVAANALREAAALRRYVRMLRKDRDRYKAMVHLREDE